MTQQTSSSPHFTELDVAPTNLFDVNSARDARPVVPFTTSSHAKPAGRRSWLLGAIAVSALIGSLTGIAAFNLYQRRNAPRATNIVAPQVAASPLSPTPQAIASPVLEASATVTATPTTPIGNDALHAPAVNGGAGKSVASTNRPDAASNNSDSDAREKRSVKKPAVVNVNETNADAARTRPNISSVSRERDTRDATRDEKPIARANRSAERERRVTSPRTEQPQTEVESDQSLTTRPGYVDAVRRAIGDRPGGGRRQQQRRREREANADRVREIFEGQSPSR